MRMKKRILFMQKQKRKKKKRTKADKKRILCKFTLRQLLIHQGKRVTVFSHQVKEQMRLKINESLKTASPIQNLLAFIEEKCILMFSIRGSATQNLHKPDF